MVETDIQSFNLPWKKCKEEQFGSEDVFMDYVRVIVSFVIISTCFLLAEFRFHNSTSINNNSSRRTNGFEWNNLKLDSGISRFKRQIQEIPKEASDHRVPDNSDDDKSEENDKHSHAQNSFQNNVNSRVNKLLVRDDETTTSDSTSTTSSSTTTTVPTTTSSTTPTTSTTATSKVTTQSTTTTSTTSTTFPPITTAIPPTTATSTVTTTLPSTIIITTPPITTSTMTKTVTSTTATTSSTTLAATITTPKTTNIENVNTSTVITPTKSMTSTTQAADATPSFIEETSSVSIGTQSSTSKPEKLVTSTASFFNTSTKIALTSAIKDELTTIKKISRATATIPSYMQTSSASPTTNESSTSIMTPINATTNYNVSTTDTTIASTSKIQAIEKIVSSARVPNALKSSTMSTRRTILKIMTTSIIKVTSSKENATSRMSTVTVTPANTPSATKMSAIAKSLTAALTTSIPLNMKADNITENAIFVDINRSSSHNYSQTIQSDKILISTLESTELSPIVTSYASGQYHRTGAGSIPLDPIVPISTEAGRVVWNEQGQNEIGSTVPHNSSFVPLHHEKIVGMNDKHSISDQNRNSGNSEVGEKLVVANDIEVSTPSEQPEHHSQKIESFPWATAAIMVSGLLITISVCTAVVLYTQRSKAERESLREIRVGQVATPEFSTGTMRSG
ncbi:hypothetical protein Ddc_01527 [Ditylenchus destructor]|nr:hypothetical protein Ddc_01527 [Ditylenchus destructor]